MSGSQTHNQLMSISSSLPCRLIVVEGRPYLERYFVTQLNDGRQIWLHRFLSGDQDRFFHSHPWFADSILLVGSYTEEYMKIEVKNTANLVVSYKTETRNFKPGDTNIINPETLHRISRADKNTWTLLTVKPDWGKWYFINDKGFQIEMGKTHGPDWHKYYSPRL